MTLEKALRFLVLACVFALPFLALYVSRTMFFPFITGKNFAFRILVEIALSGWIVLALLNPAYRPKKQWLLWAFAALVAIMATADLFGVYPHKSFWSNYERMDGFVTLAHLFAYFLVASSVLNTERLWRAFWHTSLAVAGLVSLIGIMQLLGMVQINQSGTRLDARLGNATYAGVYMLFHIAIAALMLARAWVNDPRNRVTLAWVYGISMALNFIVLFYTETRGAILGVVGGALLAALLLAIVSGEKRLRQGAAALAFGIVLFAGGAWLARDSAFVHGIPPLRRAVTSFEDASNDARLMNWAMAWQGFQERPILGWGHENYAAVFDSRYNPDMFGQEPWFDRTHNIVFDWLIAGGILGLLAYLSLYVLALLALWRNSAFAPYERAILTGLFGGYFFYLLFTFDNILSYILFVSVLAYIATRSSMNEKPLLEAHTAASAAGPVLAGLALVVAGGLVWTVNADAIRQNKALIQAIQPQSGGVEQNLTLFQEAAAYNSVGNQEVREQFSQAAVSIVNNAQVPVEFKQRFGAAASDEMEKQVAAAPMSARAPFFLGILYDHAGSYAEGKKWLDVAIERSPKKQAILFELGLNATARGESDEALANFKEAYDAAPEYREAQIYYAAALIRAGNDAEAEKVLQPRIEAGNAADQRIASSYASRERYDKIAVIWTAHVEKNPQDIDAWFLLAGAYYAAKDTAAAIRTLEAAKAAVPSAAAQADDLIKQVRTGQVQ